MQRKAGLSVALSRIRSLALLRDDKNETLPSIEGSNPYAAHQQNEALITPRCLTTGLFVPG